MLRRNRVAETGPRWPVALGLAGAAFLLLAVSGWIGGKLAFEHRIGVIEEEKPGSASPAVRPARRA